MENQFNIWSYRRGKRGSYETEKKNKLKRVFMGYAKGDVLDKEQLKNAFEHLDAALPNMQAEQALLVAGTGTGTGKDAFVSCKDENDANLKKLVDYAYDQGYRYYW